MSQTLAPRAARKSLGANLERLKRFFKSLASPSPLGWILVTGVSFVCITLFEGSVVALLFFIPILYVVFHALEAAVHQLKRRIIDTEPPIEQRFWDAITRLTMRTASDHRRMNLIAILGNIGMLGPPILEPLLGSSSLILSVGCGMVFSIGLFAQVITRWCTPTR